MSETPAPLDEATPRPAAAAALAALCAASALVLVASLLASFRQGFAADLPTLLTANGPRVLLAAAAGVAFAGAGALRQSVERERPLRGLAVLAVSAGGATGGFALAELVSGGPSPLVFATGALGGAGLGLALVRSLERPRRWTNFAAAALLTAAAAACALVGSYARARQDLVSAGVAWLLGDLSGATFASGALLLVLAGALLALGARAAAASRDRARRFTLLALGVGVGAAGPLAFVGSLVPRTVRWLAGPTRPASFVATSALAGAATVAAVDAVPRLVVGGYDFPFNLSAALLAIPIFLGWNRRRLRALAGPSARWEEGLELVLIVSMTLLATGLAVFLGLVVREAT